MSRLRGLEECALQPQGKSFPGKMRREKSKGPEARMSPAFQGARRQGESGIR